MCYEWLKMRFDDRNSRFRGAEFTTIRRLVLSLIVTVGFCGRAAGESSKILSLDPIKIGIREDAKDKSKVTVKEQDAKINLGPVSYSIRHHARYREGDPAQFIATGEYISMPAPTMCNWYHAGFLFLDLNGVCLGKAPISSMTVSETGERGILDMVWHHEMADVRARFLGSPGSDHLLCEIALDAKRDLTSVKIRLCCYPSFFTHWYKRAGARRVQTPAELISEGEKATLPPRQGWWAVYYDEVFDIAKGEGAGPCAMMVSPETVQEICIVTSDDAVNTHITCLPSVRNIRLAFWDFKGKTNIEALERVRTGAESLRQTLQSADFIPSLIARDAPFFRDKLREVREALADADICKLLGERLEKVRNWYNANQAFEPDSDAFSIRDQEELLQFLKEFNSFIWEVRLAELVSRR